MLKGIPSLLSPELLKILMEMGHGDEIVIGDGNFPAASSAQRLVRCDGHGVPDHHAFEKMERFAFYERAKKAYAIATGESAIYANIILKKGVVK